MLAEDLRPFFADFGGTCTLNGVQVLAIVNVEGFEDPDTGVVTEGPSALVRASEAASAAPGQPFVAGTTTYKVRQKLSMPPDGVMVRLVLAKV